LTLVVEDIMARDVVTIEANFSVKYAARVMSLYGISSVIVLDDGKMKGILTEKVYVREIMTCPVIVVEPTTSLEDAVQTMVMKKIKKLPVMSGDSDDSELLGILSLTDVARIQPLMIESLKELAQLGQIPETGAGFYVR
jgi:CBS domain-containing protein